MSAAVTPEPPSYVHLQDVSLLSQRDFEDQLMARANGQGELDAAPIVRDKDAVLDLLSKALLGCARRTWKDVYRLQDTKLLTVGMRLLLEGRQEELIGELMRDIGESATARWFHTKGIALEARMCVLGQEAQFLLVGLWLMPLAHPLAHTLGAPFTGVGSRPGVMQ